MHVTRGFPPHLAAVKDATQKADSVTGIVIRDKLTEDSKTIKKLFSRLVCNSCYVWCPFMQVELSTQQQWEAFLAKEGLSGKFTDNSKQLSDVGLKSPGL